jgi:hypothetical protein
LKKKNQKDFYFGRVAKLPAGRYESVAGIILHCQLRYGIALTSKRALNSHEQRRVSIGARAFAAFA